MTRHVIKRVVLALTIVTVPPCVFAQDGAYDADAKTLQSERMQKLAEIDRLYDEATRAGRSSFLRSEARIWHASVEPLRGHPSSIGRENDNAAA